MKKSLFFLIVFLTISSFLSAQLLWKISGNGLKQSSYLFGSHHLIPIQFLDSVPGLFKAFNECETVVGEIVIDNAEAAAFLQKAAIMPNKITMSSLLTRDQYQLVDNELKNILHLGLKELDLMNPNLITILYETELYRQTTDYSADISLDSYFQLVAVDKGKNVKGLETIEKQVETLFSNKNLQHQAEELVHSIQHKDSILKEMSAVNQLYRKGKLEELASFSKKDELLGDMSEEEYIQLLDARNEEWMKILPSLIKNSACFIVVGALHLPGEKGLVYQLQKLGYKVKPVKGNIS